MKGYFEIFVIGLRHLKKCIIDDARDDADETRRIGMAGLIAFIPLALLLYLVKKNDLKNYGEWSVGAIYEERGGKNAHFLYRFYVDSIEYVGSAASRMSKICIGDSLYVHYDRTNPSNNAPGRYFEYVLDTEQLPDTVYYRRKMNNQRRPLIYQ